MNAAAPDKAKMARRVVEVLEFFDQHREATVMDIVRCFDWPQSSTSELLSSLVHMGLLYKDPCSRSYSATPRAAMLGSAVQPSLVRDGRLMRLIDALSNQTGHGVGVFGMVALNVLICSWRPGKRAQSASHNDLGGGRQTLVTDSAVGGLLLSTVPKPRRHAMIRRINAEAPPELKFSFSDVAARIDACTEQEHQTGAVGFGSGANVTAILLPGLPERQPLAIGFVYEQSAQVVPAALLQSLKDGIARHVDGRSPTAAHVQPLYTAPRQVGMEMDLA